MNKVLKKIKNYALTNVLTLMDCEGHEYYADLFYREYAKQLKKECTKN